MSASVDSAGLEKSPSISSSFKPSLKFPKRMHLLRPGEFRRVFQSAKRVRSYGIMLLFCPNDLGYPRIGFAVAKKHIPTAVGRNKLKRCVRERFRLISSSLPAIDVVVLSQKGINDFDKTETWLCINKVWEKLLQRCGSA